MQFQKARLVIKQEGREDTLDLPDLSCRQGLVTVTPTRRQLPHGELLSVHLSSKSPVELVEFTVEASLDNPGSMLVNGFQSWSQTREFTAGQSVSRLFPLAGPLLESYGDYHITKTSEKPGSFHSWSWTSFSKDQDRQLIASIAEAYGYTLFEADLTSGTLRITRDCKGQKTDSYPLFQIYMGKGSEAEVWAEYAGLLPQPLPARRCTGWTSWYNYYTKINEDIIYTNLEALADSGHPFQVFQIDDGWQGAIGDWLDVNAKFPQGMGSLARAIRAKGFRPGLWLAPFICTAKSRIWRENYDWVLKDDKGRPVKAGWNPGWTGWFYALDFYAPGFQTWLKEVFDTIKNQWGYQMVKLDFLYAVALRPNNGRCRGRIMAEAMDYLRQVCGDQHILGCGVPLAQSAGKVEYCRIGSDVAPYWEDRFLQTIGYKERVSTLNSLYSTLHRHMLDKRLFRNDPDVFILRDGKPGVNANKLTPQQRHTLFFLNNLLGSLVFLSDNIGEYTQEQKAGLAEMFPSLEPEITSIAHKDDVYTVEFSAGGRDYVALANLSAKPVRQALPPGDWFHPALFVLGPGLAIDLEPHETICLVKDQPAPGPRILGSSGHIFPGAQVEEFAKTDKGWSLTLKAHSAPHSRVWIAVPTGTKTLRVNGQLFPVREKAGISYIIV